MVRAVINAQKICELHLNLILLLKAFPASSVTKGRATPPFHHVRNMGLPSEHALDQLRHELGVVDLEPLVLAPLLQILPVKDVVNQNQHLLRLPRQAEAPVERKSVRGGDGCGLANNDCKVGL